MLSQEIEAMNAAVERLHRQIEQRERQAQRLRQADELVSLARETHAAATRITISYEAR